MPASRDTTVINGTTDVWCVDDFKSTMPMVFGREALAQRLMRRLTTRPGQLPFWPNDGLDVRDYLLSKANISNIPGAVEAECLKDEQVEDVSVQSSISDDGRSLTLRILIEDAQGPFTFTMTVDDAQTRLVELINSA